MTWRRRIAARGALLRAASSGFWEAHWEQVTSRDSTTARRDVRRHGMRGLLPFFLLSFLSPPWPLELLHAGEDSCDLVATRRGVLAGSGVLETRRVGGTSRDLLVASRWAARR